VWVLRTTDAIATRRRRDGARSVDAGRDDLDVPDFLTWKGTSPRAAAPARSPSARRRRRRCARRLEVRAVRVARRGRASSTCPPSRVSMRGGAIDRMEMVRMADVKATVATFTVDRLAFSLSPPVVSPSSTSTAVAGSSASSPTRPHVRPHRRPRGDDVPQAVLAGRDPQLLLEGTTRRRRSTHRTNPRRRRTQEWSADMASNGIRDRVAIIGMGCTNFGAHWDKSATTCSSTPRRQHSPTPA
jgi:hypothetical protein